MAAGELSPADHGPDLAGQLKQTQRIGDRRARLDDALRDLLLRQAIVAHQLLIALRFLDRVEVLPLQILDERKLHNLALARLDDHRRDFIQTGLPRGTPSPLACDDLIIAFLFTRAHRDRRNDAVQTDAFRELVERLLREYLPRLAGVRFDAADRDLADAVRRGLRFQINNRRISEQVGQAAAQSLFTGCHQPFPFPFFARISSASDRYASAPRHMRSYSVIGLPWLGASLRRTLRGTTDENTSPGKCFLTSSTT